MFQLPSFHWSIISLGGLIAVEIHIGIEEVTWGDGQSSSGIIKKMLV